MDKREQELGQENFVGLLEKLKQARETKKKTLAERIVGLPLELRKRIEEEKEKFGQKSEELLRIFQEKYEKRVDLGILQEMLKDRKEEREKELEEFLERRIDDLEMTIDERFDMPRLVWAKRALKESIDRIIGEEDYPESWKKTARLCFDLNGLKAVNDLGDHEKGNEYLKRIARVFKEGKTVSQLREQGMEVLATSDGGDEFGLVLYGEKLKEEETVRKVLKEIEKEINDLPVGDLLDFNDADVLKKAPQNRPEGFQFRASIAGGAASLLKLSLDQKIIQGVQEKFEKGGYLAAVSALMGEMINMSDKAMQEDKADFKARLELAEPGADDHYYGLVLKRTDEARTLQEKNALLQKRKQISDELLTLTEGGDLGSKALASKIQALKQQRDQIDHALQ